MTVKITIQSFSGFVSGDVHHGTHGCRYADTEWKRDASGVTHENGRRGKIG